MDVGVTVTCFTLQASLFGRNDGQGCSLVYYFALPEGWTPEQERNQVLFFALLLPPAFSARCIVPLNGHLSEQAWPPRYTLCR